MKSEDIKVGEDYAQGRSEYGGGNRVRILHPPGTYYDAGSSPFRRGQPRFVEVKTAYEKRRSGGKVLVQPVHDDGTAYDEGLLRGPKLVATSTIIAPWEEFAKEQKKVKARKEKQLRDRETRALENEGRYKRIRKKLKALGIDSPGYLRNPAGVPSVDLDLGALEKLVSLIDIPA